MITVTPQELIHAAVAATNVAHRHHQRAGYFLSRSLAIPHSWASVSICRELAEEQAREAYAAELENRDLSRVHRAHMDSRRHSAEVPA